MVAISLTNIEVSFLSFEFKNLDFTCLDKIIVNRLFLQIPTRYKEWWPALVETVVSEPESTFRVMFFGEDSTGYVTHTRLRPFHVGKHFINSK